MYFDKIENLNNEQINDLYSNIIENIDYNLLASMYVVCDCKRGGTFSYTEYNTFGACCQNYGNQKASGYYAPFNRCNELCSSRGGAAYSYVQYCDYYCAGW